MAKLYKQNDPRRTIDVVVANPRIHILEDGKSITIRYSRKHDGQAAITTFQAANAVELKSKFPQWDKFYKKHGGGTSRRIAIGAKSVGDIFLRLLKMITIPLIVTSLITGVSGLGDTSRFGSMFGKTLLYYAVTSQVTMTES